LGIIISVYRLSEPRNPLNLGQEARVFIWHPLTGHEYPLRTSPGRAARVAGKEDCLRGASVSSFKAEGLKSPKGCVCSSWNVNVLAGQG